MVGSRVVLAVGEGEDDASEGSMENYDWLEQSDEDQEGEVGSGQASVFPEVPGPPSANSEEVKAREEEHSRRVVSLDCSTTRARPSSVLRKA